MSLAAPVPRSAAADPADAGAGGAPLVEARAVTVRYGDAAVLRRASLALPPGGRQALLGPNGAGKSTLLRVLAGLIRPAEGDVLLGGRPLARDGAAARAAVGFVGHESLLTPALTARENLALFARLYGLPHPERRADDALDRVGLREKASAPARTLSRGMTQRLALARALLHDPALLLLDEPDAGLDVAAFATLRGLVLDGSGRAVVLVTHDLAHAVDLCDRVAIMHRGAVRHVGPLAGSSADDLRQLYDRVTSRPAP